MTAGFAHKDFYRLDPWPVLPGAALAPAASAQHYNQRDKAKAQRLLKEAGYGRGAAA